MKTVRPRGTPVLGITGTIAAGKSTVAALLARRGAEVIDADRIGHETLQRPEVKKSLRDEFGDGIFDETGAARRDALAQKVFADAKRLERLNAVMHPVMIDEIRRRIEEAKTRHVPLVVVDAALLVEADLDSGLCDALVFVGAHSAQRLDRARQARDWDAEKFARREGSQMDPELKSQRAEFALDNSGSLQELEESVERLWRDISKRTK